MKRYIRSSFSPEDNPTDAARAVVDQLNSDITQIHNIVLKCKKEIQDYPDDDSRMNQIVDKLAYMQKLIDNIRDHYDSGKETDR